MPSLELDGFAAVLNQRPEVRALVRLPEVLIPKWAVHWMAGPKQMDVAVQRSEHPHAPKRFGELELCHGITDNVGLSVAVLNLEPDGWVRYVPWQLRVALPLVLVAYVDSH